MCQSTINLLYGEKIRLYFDSFRLSITKNLPLNKKKYKQLHRANTNIINSLMDNYYETNQNFTILIDKPEYDKNQNNII